MKPIDEDLLTDAASKRIAANSINNNVTALPYNLQKNASTS
jgi:hypothetical protein